MNISSSSFSAVKSFFTLISRKLDAKKSISCIDQQKKRVKETGRETGIQTQTESFENRFTLLGMRTERGRKREEQFSARSSVFGEGMKIPSCLCFIPHVCYISYFPRTKSSLCSLQSLLVLSQELISILRRISYILRFLFAISPSIPDVSSHFLSFIQLHFHAASSTVMLTEGPFSSIHKKVG